MHPCRRIVFELLSHDQGSSWDRAYHGTYAHSWTWVDVNLQRNVHADSQSKRHVVAWEWQDTVEEGSVRVLEAENLGRVWRSLDGELIRGLQYGDRIVLWMHARFPGWACYLSEARVTVYSVIEMLNQRTLVVSREQMSRHPRCADFPETGFCIPIGPVYKEHIQ